MTALVVLLGALVGGCAGRAPGTVTRYADQLASPVRGLSAEEVDDLLTGRGAGLARTAELNGYPGPRHALDLRRELQLTSERAAAIEGVFAAMQVEARRLGEEIVRREGALSARFADGSLTEAALRADADTLATLYGRLRATHFAAHLAIRPLLTTGQVARYNRLRGYEAAGAHGASGPHRHQ